MELQVIKSRLYRTGATDTEPGLLEKLMDQLQHGDILPEEAVRRARNIEETRQDYH